MKLHVGTANTKSSAPERLQYLLLSYGTVCQQNLERERERERERENFICKAGTPKGQPPINAGAYVTVHNNAHIEEREKTSKKQCVYRVRK